MQAPSVVLMLSHSTDVSAAVLQAAQRLGVSLEPAQTSRLGSGLTKTVWSTSAGRIQCFDDEALPACWLEVVGFSPTEREQIETVLRRDLETPSYEQLLAWAADPAVRGGLMRAVLARRPRDTGALSTLAIAGLGDPNVDRRFEAASALALLGDRSCIGALRAAMHLEPDPGVQASLAQCLAELGE